jgi:hypothetical protein
VQFDPDKITDIAGPGGPIGVLITLSMPHALVEPPTPGVPEAIPVEDRVAAYMTHYIGTVGLNLSISTASVDGGMLWFTYTGGPPPPG